MKLIFVIWQLRVIFWPSLLHASSVTTENARRHVYILALVALTWCLVKRVDKSSFIFYYLLIIVI
jgi:hypothetical protein